MPYQGAIVEMIGRGGSATYSLKPERSFRFPRENNSRYRRGVMPWKGIYSTNGNFSYAPREVPSIFTESECKSEVRLV